MKVDDKQSALGIDFKKIKEAQLLLRALLNKGKVEVLTLIKKHGRIHVTDIYNKLKMEQPVASQHLATLRRFGVLDTERDGKFIYYSINEKKFNQINQITNILN